MKERLARAVFWVIWSRSGIQLLSFLSTLVMARLLNPSDYGLMALATVWTGSVGMIAHMGLGMAIVQFRDLEEGEVSACFWLTFGLSSAGYLAIYIAAPSIAAWFATPALKNVLRVSGLALPIVALRVIPDGILRRRLQLDRVSQVELISVVASIPVMLSIAWAGAGVWALVAGALVTSLVHTVLSFWFVRWWPSLHMGGRRFYEVVRYSLAILGSRICFVIYQGSDTFVLGKISGDVVLGLYSMAKHLSILPVGRVSDVVNLIAAPVMASMQKNREAMRDSFLRGVRLVTWVTFPLCIGSILVAEDFVRVVLTEKWITAVPMMRVLCVYAMIRSLAVLLPPVLQARFRAKFLFGYNFTLLMVMPLAFWAGAAWSGGLGLAAAWVVVYPILMARLARVTLGELGLSWRTLWSQLWRPLAAAIGMAGIVIAVGWAVSTLGGDLPLARLVAMIVVGGLAYGTGLLMIDGQFWGESREVLGWVLRPKRAVRAPRQAAFGARGER